jgi:hypothetical protein
VAATTAVAVATAVTLVACTDDGTTSERTTTTVLVVSAEAQRICDILDAEGVEAGVEQIVAAVELFGSGTTARDARDAIAVAVDRRCPALRDEVDEALTSS